MAKKPLPSPEELRQLLAYDPATGGMTWLPRSEAWFAEDSRLSASGRAACWNGKHAGTDAFSSRTAKGYLRGAILGQRVMAHRVAFALHHGRWPEGEVDHINGIRDDNRAANLREADRQTNCRNRVDGRGYHYDPRGQSNWRAYIRHEGRNVYLGRHRTEAEAMAARSAAEVRYGYDAIRSGRVSAKPHRPTP